MLLASTEYLLSTLAGGSPKSEGFQTFFSLSERLHEVVLLSLAFILSVHPYALLFIFPILAIQFSLLLRAWHNTAFLVSPYTSSLAGVIPR